MNSRTMLAVSLCCFIWFSYLQWFAPKTPPKDKEIQNQASTATPVSPSSPTSSTLSSTNSTVAPSGTFQVVNSVILENQDVRVYFTSAGGKPYRAEVLKYQQTIDKTSPPIELFHFDQNPTILATVFSNSDLKKFETSNYDLKEQSVSRLRYEAASSDFVLVKEYTLVDKHVLEVKYSLKAKATSPKDLGYLSIPLSAKGLISDQHNPLKAYEMVGYQNDTPVRKTPESITEPVVTQGNTSWIAFGNRYFTTVVSNASTVNPDVIFAKVQDEPSVSLRYPIVLKSDQTEAIWNLKTYVGPKSSIDLQVIPNGYRLVDYGMFRILAYPMLDLLRFFYRYVHNYGIAIILLTVLVRILFFPLGVKSARSMKSMQKLQPQVQALKEKYKDDLNRFNQEQMALFKQHKVNPLGGCLPILVQIPVFLALYAVLANSIELFHAPFFGWLKDLSAKDPYFICPILMGAAMLGQQIMTPMVGMDPMQRKMMMFMPVMMTFFMVNLPAGLTVYFFLSTTLGILQQYFTNRDSSTNAVQPVRVSG